MPVSPPAKLRWFPLACTLLLGLTSSCHEAGPTAADSPTASVAPHGSPAAPSEGYPDLPATSAFTFEIAITDPLIPQQDVGLQVRFVSRVPLANGRLTLLVPELARSSLGEGVAIGQAVPPLWQLERRFQYDEVYDLARVLRFPAEGLYRLLIYATAVQGAALDRVTALHDVVYKELWLVVDSTGGSVLSSLDLSSFRKTVVPVRRPSPSTPSAQANLAGCDTWQVLWLNDRTNQYEAVAGVPAWGSVVEDQTGNPVASWNASTDSNGMMTICAAGNGTSYYGEVYLQDQIVTISPTSGAFVSGSATGEFFQTYISAGRGRLWRNFQTLIPRSRASLGKSRAAINVNVVNDCPRGAFACYKDPGDYIVIPPGNELGDFAMFSQGHEYGHALHKTALGGLPGSNCSRQEGHNVDQATFFSCALREGFAHFHGAIVFAPELLNQAYFSDFAFEQNQSYPGYVYVNGQRTTTQVLDGSIVEGAIAAFLYDLYDGPSSPDSQTGGSDNDDDAVEFPGLYIAEIIGTCLADGNRANGIDHMIYCFERQIDPAVTSATNYFPTRGSDPTSFSENAAEPPGWSATAIRTLWVKNLYNNAPPQYGSGSAPTVTISGPSSVRAGATCRWTANPTGGTPPYVYAWWVNGNAVGGNSSELIYGNGGSNFTVTVQVTDGALQSGSNATSVTVSSSAPICFY